MLKSSQYLKQFSINSKKETFGIINDFYFGDLFWKIEYLIIKPPDFQQEKKLFLTHLLQINTDIKNHIININKSLTRLSYHSNPFYKKIIKGIPVIKSAFPCGPFDLQLPKDPYPVNDYYLRSMNNIIGYEISTKNGKQGIVNDFIIETDNLKIRYLMIIIVDNHSHNRYILIAPSWIEKINWNENVIYINLKKETLKNSPSYNPQKSIDKNYELKLSNYFHHYINQNG